MSKHMLTMYLSEILLYKEKEPSSCKPGLRFKTDPEKGGEYYFQSFAIYQF